MVRFLNIIAAFLFLSSLASTKSNPKELPQSTDSLRKYCYRLSGFVSPEPSQIEGTGFFFRKDEKLYLITAKHVLSGCMMSGKTIRKDSLYSKYMLIFGKTDSNETTTIMFDITKIKDTSSCLHFFQDPDIIAVEVQNKEVQNKYHMKIYSIENFTHSMINKNGNIAAFGFPADSNVKNNRPNFSAPAGSLYWDTNDYDIPFSHPINDIVLNKNQKIPVDISLKGYSGSPVFFKEIKSNKWGIAGVLAGVISDTLRQRYFVIPKIDFAISDINRKKD